MRLGSSLSGVRVPLLFVPCQAVFQRNGLARVPVMRSISWSKPSLSERAMLESISEDGGGSDC